MIPQIIEKHATKLTQPSTQKMSTNLYKKTSGHFSFYANTKEI